MPFWHSLITRAVRRGSFIPRMLMGLAPRKSSLFSTIVLLLVFNVEVGQCMAEVQVGSMSELLAASHSSLASTRLEFITADSRDVITVGQIFDRSLRVAAGLRQLGVVAGDR